MGDAGWAAAVAGATDGSGRAGNPVGVGGVWERFIREDSR